MSEEQKKRLEEYSKECLEVSKVEEAVLKEAEKGVFLDDPKLKVHALCFSKKIHMQNEKGEIQVDVIKEKLTSQIKSAEEVEKVVKLCLVQKDTPENTAFEGLQCLQKNVPKDVVLF